MPDDRAVVRSLLENGGPEVGRAYETRGTVVVEIPVPSATCARNGLSESKPSQGSFDVAGSVAGVPSKSRPLMSIATGPDGGMNGAVGITVPMAMLKTVPGVLLLGAAAFLARMIRCDVILRPGATNDSTRPFRSSGRTVPARVALTTSTGLLPLNTVAFPVIGAAGPY